MITRHMPLKVNRMISIQRHISSPSSAIQAFREIETVNRTAPTRVTTRLRRARAVLAIFINPIVANEWSSTFPAVASRWAVSRKTRAKAVVNASAVMQKLLVSAAQASITNCSCRMIAHEAVTAGQISGCRASTAIIGVPHHTTIERITIPQLTRFTRVRLQAPTLKHRHSRGSVRYWASFNAIAAIRCHVPAVTARKAPLRARLSVVTICAVDFTVMAMGIGTLAPKSLHRARLHLPGPAVIH